MARPRLHDDDTVLDAAAQIVMERGSRAATIAAIAKASGAPVGSLYHRFASRDAVLLALWSRAIARFHERYLQAAHSDPDPVRAGVAMAASVVDFARERPRDAELLLTLRRADLLDGEEPMDDVNAAVARAVRDLAARLPVSAERVRLALIDLPYGAVRRHLARGRVPAALRAEVAAAAAALLQPREEQP